ncbi:MAG: hypothetical protein QOF76_1921 [Solirubrobacteraceae bacterium]|nr:hypothetical protein [Solirubrobacteraceae bacterium]
MLAVALAWRAAGRAGGRAALREPLVLVLLALAAVAAISVAWTIGPVEDAWIWALVTAGYAAVAGASAAVVARPGGLVVLAVGLAVIAAIAAALGLAGAAVGDGTFAERIAGVWRPGGPFEYPPALALAQVATLPILLSGMASRSRVVALAAAAGMTLAGGVLALAASRTALAMALVVAGWAIAAAPPRCRRLPAVATALGALAGVGVAAAHDADPWLRSLVLATVVLLTAVWPPLRARLAGRGRASGHGPDPTVTHAGARPLAAILAIGALAGAFAFGGAAERGSGPASDFLHGRGHTWRAAIDSWQDRPVRGAGADAFLTASARHQGGATIAFAHDLPLELAAELGIAGFLLALALYAATARLVWRARATPAAALFAPGAVAFLASNLVDWPWHLAGSGALWAIAVGALTGSVTPLQAGYGACPTHASRSSSPPIVPETRC